MNMILTSLIQYAILLSMPLLSMLVVWFCHRLVRSLPTRPHEALEQFARMAVQQIEQQNASLSSADKKQLAIDLVLKLFNIFKIPAPPVEIIDVAIEAAVFFIKQIPAAVGADKIGQ
jgi:LL-H family phage holin